MLAVVFPEPRRLGFQRVHDHQKFQLGQRLGQLGPVGEGQKGVEALTEVVVDLARLHQVEHAQDVIARHVQLGQVVIGPVVFGRSGIAPHGLHEADHELGIVLPIAGLTRPQRLEVAAGHIGGPVRLFFGRDVEIARDQVRHQPQVGQALNVGMAAQRVHPAAPDADIAQDQLQHRHAANILRTLGMLGPAKRIHRGHGLVGRRAFADHLGDMQEAVLGRAADLLDQLGRVARDMLFQQVPDTARVLQGHVDLRKPVLADHIVPARLVVIPFFGVVAGKQPVAPAELVLHDEGGIGEVLHIFPLDPIVLDHPVDHGHQEGDVRAGPDRRVIVGHGCGAREPGVHHDQLGTPMRLGLGHPFEAAGMRFGCIAAHHDHQIGVLDVGPGVGHRSAAKCWAQTGHRGAVSDARLVIES